jgi:thioredoxin 1
VSELKSIGEDEFKAQVIEAPAPVLVEFGAVWCHPCKQLEKVLLQISQALEGKFTLVKVDVDDSVQVAMQYQVMSVPTLILFKSGAPAERWIGLQAKDRILAKLEPHL